MKTVYRYKLNHNASQGIDIPEGSKILTVDYQEDNQLTLWAMVDPSKPPVRRMVNIYGTGWDIPEMGARQEFIGTVFTGPLVWHIFCDREE